MRTTVEIPDGQRARLLKLAAERGEKGFSKLVQEALEMYLREDSRRRDRIEKAKSVLGSFNAGEAESLTLSILELRKRWR